MVNGIFAIAVLPAVAPYIATITLFSGIHFADEFSNPNCVICFSVLCILLKMTSDVLSHGIFPPS